jgi:hypothetical protein
VTDFLFDTRAGLMLFGVIVLAVLVIISWYISLPFDRWRIGRQLAKQTSGANRSRQVDVPPELAASLAPFKEVGFGDVTTIQEVDGSVHALLLSDEGRVIAEAATVRDRRRAGAIGLDQIWKHAPSVVLELTSSLLGHRGLLATSNFGLGLYLWDAELRQVFPGASAANLVRYHRDALGWLEQQGITAESVAADEVVKLRADLLKRSSEATARSSSKAIRKEGMRAGQGQHAYVGSLSDDVDIASRLKRFWHTIGER